MQPIYLIGTILEIIGSYLLYAYLVSRTKEHCSIKDFFAPGIRKGELVFTLVVVGLTLSAGIYGQLKLQYSAMQCYLNITMLFLVAAMAWVDCREKIIPNVLVLVGIGLGVIQMLTEILVIGTDWRLVLKFSLGGALIWGGILFLIALIVKSALGMGDVKLFFAIGLTYGANNTYEILLLSWVAMALISILLLAMKKATKKTAIPMAPFVLFGLYSSIMLGF